MSVVRLHPLAQALLNSALLLAVYFVIPTDIGHGTWSLLARTIATLIGLTVAVALILRQVSRQINADQAPLTGLLTALVAGVLFFALADYLVAINAPGQFVDLNTRIDALYFAISTLATVGFGDVHAQGQAARGLLCLQMLFNAVIIATGLSVLSKQISARVRERRGS
ncbi:potassium channel family protein [Catellatospora vulcania]|uniref:potassium channel family protein n=1 Tax=Catellatospora vulcania TaxID=1460450 RepID=UPI0012D41070|nr:potassium channel family protein [Catellatospora vulcania]